MNDTVYVVNWISGYERGILGVFSSRYFADQAIKLDEGTYPYPEHYINYVVEHYTLDEVTEYGF